MTTRPNVLLICTDHWTGEQLGVAGHPAIQTPGLDEIALCGVRFPNAYSECPVCIPARRTLMTGLSPRAHGDRVFDDQQRMPDVTTLAQAFRDAGYQADAVGKLHVHPQRDRIGFDNVILDDEGRPQWGVIDDYDIYLGDIGLAGRQFDHGMSNNQYFYRAWHLPEETHPTNWAARMMARTIKRRDPTRPAFWYLGFRHPHPPLVPPQAYLDLYRDIEIDAPYMGDWVKDPDALPYAVDAVYRRMDLYTPDQIRDARRAFYALCTQIDHQIRYLVGTLRLEGILDDTIVCFTSDHGDMLGNHHMLAKRVMYEPSACVPMILMGVKDDPRVPQGTVDNRLVGLQDVMPTLLDLCGVPAPDTVEGLSMVADDTRDWLYGECSEGDHATRMVHDGRYKLIYYVTANHFQLFDLHEDPKELTNLAGDPGHADALARLTEILIGQLYGEDLTWLEGGKLVGRPDKAFHWAPHRNLNSQRGDGWPPSP
ncbi:MAG: sulfatase-like hydrolase/transferase, partial [Alphaproteobacteria bacterium]|nr:sulfatase-like hydrolase/transferase [Alphaproteobacteria bacterium]